jgi:hypothetical protein
VGQLTYSPFHFLFKYWWLFSPFKIFVGKTKHFLFCYVTFSPVSFANNTNKFSRKSETEYFFIPSLTEWSVVELYCSCTVGVNFIDLTQPKICFYTLPALQANKDLKKQFVDLPPLYASLHIWYFFCLMFASLSYPGDMSTEQVTTKSSCYRK